MSEQTELSQPTETCQHENGEPLINFDYGYRGSKDRRCYEVYICLDCGKMVNGANGNTPEECEMKPLEVVQMFVDFQDTVYNSADEIQSQAKMLMEVLEGLPDRMPKAKAA